MAADDLDFGATIKGFTPGQKVFDRYTLTKILGRGGMGVVWLARDEKLDRDVALKFLPELVALDERAVDDLKRETRRALDLTHPHIVRIYDFVDDASSAAIAMEWVDGPSLSILAMEHEDRIYPIEIILPWVEQLCEALSYAHARAKVVHRDLKPANLMIDAEDMLKIADFGISATLTDSTTRVSKQAGSSGSPPYMSPQQMLGKPTAVTDDVYALGATLYELLTGKPPFYTGRIDLQVMQETPPSIAERRTELNVRNTNIVPSEWEETIAACLAKEPGDRPQSAGEVWERLNGKSIAHEISLKNTKKETVEKTSSSTPNNRTAEDKKVGSDRWADRDASAPIARESQSKAPKMIGLFVLLAVLGTAGWWFGVEQPKREAAAELVRIEEARVEAETAELARIERQKAEAARLDRERKAVELARLEKERREAAAEREAKLLIPQSGSRYTIEDLGIELMPIAAGSFMMGSPSGESGRDSDETPHRVTISRAYWLGATEVTVGQWRSFVNETGYRTEAETGDGMYVYEGGSWSKKAGTSWRNPSLSQTDDHPVVGVSWNDIQAYAKWLTERERAAGRLPAGYAYTLPSEAQWEYACRAGTTGAYAGDLDAMAWYSSNSGSTTHAVGQRRANAWGLYDMHGNVWEWCSDWFGDYPSGSVTDPAGANSGSVRVYRGGSWGDTAASARSANRNWVSPGLRNSLLGFRLALSAVR